MQVFKILESYIFRQISAKFVEEKKQHYCGDLVFAWAVLQKTVFNHY